MSISDGDIAYEMYIVEQEMLELRQEWIEEYREEYLQSFYRDHPLLAKPALDSLAEARYFATDKPSAALVFAAIAMEVGYKKTLLEPIVHGLVHSEFSTSLITDLVMAHSTLDKLKGVLTQVLKEHANLDFASFKRTGSSKTLWEEMKDVQNKRNQIMHQGKVVSKDDANNAIGVASAILEVMFPSVIAKFGFMLGEDGSICETPAL